MGTGTITTDAPQTQESRSLGFEFKGNGTEYFKIWIVNILLTILTLGIYSAWATVRNKRYFHSNLYLDDSNFRYLAEPMQILKGRIIAVVAFIIYSVVSQLNIAAGVVLLVALLVSIPYFINQSIAFNHRMSAYKNIQFRFKGSYGRAFMVFFVWPLLGMITLGILYPLAIVKANEYVVNNSAYGTTNFAFSASVKDYAVIFLTMLGVSLVIGGSAWGITFVMPTVGAVLTPIILVAMYLGIIVYFTVSMTNLFYRSVSLSEHHFTANLTMLEQTKVILIIAFLTLITMGLYLPAAKVRMTKYVCSCLTFEAKGDVDTFVAAEKDSVNAIGEEFAQVFDFG